MDHAYAEVIRTLVDEVLVRVGNSFAMQCEEVQSRHFRIRLSTDEHEIAVELEQLNTCLRLAVSIDRQAPSSTVLSSPGAARDYVSARIQRALGRTGRR